MRLRRVTNGCREWDRLKLGDLYEIGRLSYPPPLPPSSPSPHRWAEARVKIARMTLTIKLDGNWSSFQLANSAPPLSVTDSAIAPSARMCVMRNIPES